MFLRFHNKGPNGEILPEEQSVQNSLSVGSRNIDKGVWVELTYQLDSV